MYSRAGQVRSGAEREKKMKMTEIVDASHCARADSIEWKTMLKCLLLSLKIIIYHRNSIKHKYSRHWRCCLCMREGIYTKYDWNNWCCERHWQKGDAEEEKRKKDLNAANWIFWSEWIFRMNARVSPGECDDLNCAVIQVRYIAMCPSNRTVDILISYSLD